MSILINRGDIVTAICDLLRTNVTDLKLVKPYHVNWTDTSKKIPVKQEIFLPRLI